MSSPWVDRPGLDLVTVKNHFLEVFEESLMLGFDRSSFRFPLLRHLSNVHDVLVVVVSVVAGTARPKFPIPRSATN